MKKGAKKSLLQNPKSKFVIVLLFAGKVFTLVLNFNSVSMFHSNLFTKFIKLFLSPPFNIYLALMTVEKIFVTLHEQTINH